MSEPIKYEIKSLDDILRAVSAENAEFFLKDFEAFISFWCVNRAVTEATRPELLEDVIKGVKFIWIDDKKHNIKATFNVKEYPEPTAQ